MRFARPAQHAATLRCHCGALTAELWRHSDGGRWELKRTCDHDAPLPSAEDTARLLARFERTRRLVRHQLRPAP